VSETTDLVDGQTVTVDYSGFPAGATIAVVQCTSAAPADTECDDKRISLGNADAQGAGTAEFTVHTGVVGADGSTCDGAENNDCIIVVTDFPVTTSTSVPITFAATEVAAETTTTTAAEDAGDEAEGEGDGDVAEEGEAEEPGADGDAGDEDAADEAGALEDVDDDDGSSAAVPIVIGLVVVAAIGGAVLFTRRRRS
jgi:hypothetical protein